MEQWQQQHQQQEQAWWQQQPLLRWAPAAAGPPALLRTADRRAAPERIVRQETCQVEQIDGISVLRCEELFERFRLCADGQQEVVESTTTTHIRPYDGACGAGGASSSGRYDDVAGSDAVPAISAALGQMLDDFFQYANELQHSLEQQGVHVEAAGSSEQQAPGWRLPGLRPGHAGGAGGGSSGRLFGWWQRRKGSAADPAGGGAGGSGAGSQPSLQQLVRESGSSTQEI